jgi:ribosome biogenesis GTPase
MTEGGWDLEAIGYDAHFRDRLAALGDALVPARIAIAHGESYVAWASLGTCKAILVGRRIATWQEAADRPQVGDWVAGTYSESADSLLIEHVLERRTCLVRQAAGERAAAQVIAANVDVVGVVSAFEKGEGDAGTLRQIKEPRLGRTLTAVERSGARGLLILNKSDLGSEPQAVADELARLFPDVPVVLTSAAQRGGLGALDRWLSPGTTLGLVGMSGTGKSTLVNRLLGRTAQRVGDVRDKDARGRHTTTHRELFLMDDGALLIDTPGMREFGLWDPDRPPDEEPARVSFRRRRHK